MLQVTIDGNTHRFPEGTRLLEALQSAGRAVPHLCHDKRLAPAGACRMCVVSVAGEPHPVASCSTALADGMVIETHTPELEKLRKTNLSLMVSHYPAKAVAAEPQHPFHRLLTHYGVTPGNETAPYPVFTDDSHPYLGIALDRCIHCQRCVRICDEVQGQFVWSNQGRGEQTRITLSRGKTLVESGCVSCGACVDTCPSGALFDKSSTGPVDTWTRSTCVYCGVGCQMEVGSYLGRVVEVRPADSPVNHGHLCVKGRYAFGFAQADDRITSPMIRSGDTWKTVGWDEALDFAAGKLMAIRERDGAHATGVLGSARSTNEENYLAQKFARVVLGTHNVDCCARVCHTPSAKALKLMLGTGAATNTFDDIEQARIFLVSGCNPTENHPVVGARIRQAVLAGARLIVVDPRRTELAELADLHLAVRPGGNVPLFNAMAATLVGENLVDRRFIESRVSDYEAFTRFIADYAPEKVSGDCGIPAADIRAAARLYASQQPAMCFHGLGMTEHTQGTEGVMTLINLALLTGNLGKPGGGINPLRGQNNVQGSAQMGCDPQSLTGSQSMQEAGPRFEAAWGSPLPTTPGLDLLSMMDAACQGQFKALWAIGYDIYQSLANATATAQALSSLELLIVQDLFLNETARRFGHVFFPAASVFEKDGTFMNSDRRVQRVRRAADPVGDSQPDWWIIQQLAQRMGHTQGFSFSDPQSIWDEVRSLWPAGAGLSYERLEHESLHWPCPDTMHPGTPILHGTHFQGSERASLARIPFVPSDERCDSDYPFLLVTGRTLYQFNAGTMTGRTPNNVLRPSDTLDMSPADAARLGLQDGNPVLVSSRYGNVTLPLRIRDEVKAGELFATFHRPDLMINRMTSPHRDRMTKTPEYKVTAVQVERAGQ